MGQTDCQLAHRPPPPLSPGCPLPLNPSPPGPLQTAPSPTHQLGLMLVGQLRMEPSAVGPNTSRLASWEGGEEMCGGGRYSCGIGKMLCVQAKGETCCVKR